MWTKTVFVTNLNKAVAPIQRHVIMTLRHQKRMELANTQMSVVYVEVLALRMVLAIAMGLYLPKAMTVAVHV